MRCDQATRLRATGFWQLIRSNRHMLERAFLGIHLKLLAPEQPGDWGFYDQPRHASPPPPSIRLFSQTSPEYVMSAPPDAPPALRQAEHISTSWSRRDTARD